MVVLWAFNYILGMTFTHEAPVVTVHLHALAQCAIYVLLTPELESPDPITQGLHSLQSRQRTDPLQKVFCHC